MCFFLFFLFFVSGSQCQLQPDQPGLRRFLQRARKNHNFSTIYVRFGYKFCAFLHRFSTIFSTIFMRFFQIFFYNFSTIFPTIFLQFFLQFFYNFSYNLCAFLYILGLFDLTQLPTPILTPKKGLIGISQDHRNMNAAF
jgi:hypothetical protein